MPTYTYRCTACGNVFDELVYAQEERVTCPACSSDRVCRSVTAPACCTADHPRGGATEGGCDAPDAGDGGCCSTSSCCCD